MRQTTTEIAKTVLTKLAVAADKPRVTLQPHQQRVVDKLRNQDALLVYHGLGSGKTITGLAAADQLGLPLTVVGPAALRANFPKEVAKSGLVPKDMAIHSYVKPPSDVDPETLTVFDEAHRMGRMDSQASLIPDKLNSKKKLFMTGTPIRNYPHELVPILRGLGAPVPRDAAKFMARHVEDVQVGPGFWGWIRGVKPGVIQRAKDLESLKRILRGKVDYHAASAEGYPSVEESTILVDMTPKQETAYRMVLKKRPDLFYKIRHGIAPSKTESKDLNAFLSGARQISNYPVQFNTSATMQDAPKLLRAVEEIKSRFKDDPNYRGVTYSAYLRSGVDPMAQLLDEAGVPYARFTGEEAPAVRNKTIADYNAGKLRHLLLSGAGGEGLDLKGTKLIQLLEPHWNSAQLDQVKGRAVRYKSHDALPEDERKVVIQNFLARPRKKGLIFKTQDKGADEYLYEMSQRKSALNEQFLQMLRDVAAQGTAG